MADGGGVVHRALKLAGSGRERNSCSTGFQPVAFAVHATGPASRMVKWTAVAEAFNYFNYYTEIEEHFWRKRGAHILVSPLDWAIVETWQKAGIPVAAVLQGIDAAFESYARSRRGAAGRPLKSLAYCVDAVLEAAEQHAEAAAGKGPDAGGAGAAQRTPGAEPFSREELRAYFQRNAAKLARAADSLPAGMAEMAARCRDTAQKMVALLPLIEGQADGGLKSAATACAGLGAASSATTSAAVDLEDLERRLTVLEEKLAAAVTAAADEETMLATRREMDRALAPYRRKMTAAQLAQLEQQYMQKRLFEKYGIPRLSLFYLT